ncbi:MAG: KTSC domain-containing protein [Chloroflexales bacterium]|nr:KTSC domain-containing protein [Chloroflexales bacterium]
MAATITSIFQHANVEALMVTGSKPRFEISVDGQVAQVVIATRQWQSERKVVIAAAQALAGVTPEPTVVVRDPRMAAKLHPVASSFIAQVGYSTKRHELTVVFTSGRVFIYTAVTLGEFNRLRRAHSAGKAFHAIVRGKKSGFEVAQAA